MSYRILSSNVIFGDPDVGSEHAMVAAPDGTLQIERLDGNAVLFDVAGNLEADRINVTNLSIPNKVLSTDATGQVVLTGFDVDQLGNVEALTTGVLPSGRLQGGSYTLANLTATGTVTASTLVGNLDAGQLGSGTVPPARLAGGYTFDSLDLTSNISAGGWLNANIDANHITTGTLHDDRLQGSYAFDSLSLTSNLSAAWLHANVDASNITGTISADRLSGNYAFQTLTVTDVTANSVHIPSLEGSNVVLVSNADGYITASNVTLTEIEYLSGVSRPIQLQIDELQNGNIVGSNITNLDANNMTLGVVPDARMAGDYSFANLTLNGSLVAANVDANLDASQLVRGVVPSARLAGEYTLANVVVAGGVTAGTVSGNLDASQMTSGTIHPARLDGGSFSFASLDLTGNLTATTVHANIDAGQIVTGTVDADRIDLVGIRSNVVPVTTGLTLGTVSNTWSNVHVTSVHADTIDLSGNLVYRGNVVVTDLEQTHSNVVPTSSAYSLGTQSTPWSNVWANTVQAYGDVVVGGTLLNASGTPYLDLGNVETNVLPLVANLNIGTTDRPWESLTVNTATVANLTVTDRVLSSLVPAVPGLDLGNVDEPWGTVWADQVVGNVDAVNVYGELDANIVFVGGSIDDFVIKVPAGTQTEPGIRFIDDESTGLYLPQPATLGVAVAGETVLTTNASVVEVTGNIVPTTDATYDLGSTGSRWGDLHVANSVVAGPVTISSGNVTGVSTLTVTNGVQCDNVVASGTVSASTLSGNMDASYITSGTLESARIADGTDMNPANLTVSGALTVAGSTTLYPSGHVIPQSNLLYDLGSPTSVWRDVYLSGSTIYLGNATISETGGNVVMNRLVVDGTVTADGLTPPLSITSVEITDNAWTVLDDTAVGLDGGYVQLHGVGFAPACLVQVGTVNASSTTYVSSTVLRCLVPARPSGTYSVTVIRGDSVTATLPSSLTYSDVVSWITPENLGNIFFADPFVKSIVATSDSTVTYGNLTAIPSGTTLDAATGNLTGNILLENDSIFSIDVVSEDLENQTSEKTFLLDYKALNVSNVQVTDMSWSVLQQTALDSDSTGYILVNGSYFLSTDTVQIGGTPAATTYVSSSSLGALAPAKSSGLYDATVLRNGTPRGLIDGVKYSIPPSWSTASNLGEVDENTDFSYTFVATSDSSVSYTNTTALPPGSTLNTSSGVFTGNVTSLSDDQTFSFEVVATDQDFQTNVRTFLLTVLSCIE